MNTFAPPTDAYTGGFARDSQWILTYDFPAGIPTAVRTSKITQNPHNFTDISVRSLAYNATTYQMEIIAKTAGAHRYYCVMKTNVLSLELVITVTPPAPTATFTLNTTKPEVGIPFKATCALAHYAPLETSVYSVSFYSAKDGLLASYETIKGKSLVMIQKHHNVTIHDGARTGSSVFDLTLVETVDVRQAEYWCALEEAKLGLVKSKHWTLQPVVKFTSYKVNSTSYRGVCELDNFEPAGRQFSVQFLTDVGPSRVNRLAAYTVRPNQILEFFTEEPVRGWKQVLPDGVATFPRYAILATGQASISHTWWCLLTVGTHGSNEYQEYPSGAVFF